MSGDLADPGEASRAGRPGLVPQVLLLAPAPAPTPPPPLPLNWLHSTPDTCNVSSHRHRILQDEQPLRLATHSTTPVLQATQHSSGEAASPFSSFTGLLSHGRGLVAAAAAGGCGLNAGSGDEALLLSPLRRSRHFGDSDLCFSPVLLTRRGAQNLILGNPLDVQLPGAPAPPYLPHHGPPFWVYWCF